MGGACRQMPRSVCRAVAGGVIGHPNPRSVRVEEMAVAGSKLGQGYAVGTGKGGFRTLGRRRGA